MNSVNFPELNSQLSPDDILAEFNRALIPVIFSADRDVEVQISKQLIYELHAKEVKPGLSVWQFIKENNLAVAGGRTVVWLGV